MPSHRKSPETKSTIRVPTSARSGPAPRRGNRRSPAPTDATTKRWRRDVRPRSVRSAVSATASLRWSPSLMKVLIEELYVDDGLEELLGKASNELQMRQLPAGGRGSAHTASQLARRRSRLHPRTTRLDERSVPKGNPSGLNSRVAENDTEASNFFQLIPARPSSAQVPVSVNY